MQKQLLSVFIKTTLPPLLGALGAILATMFPAYYSAVCGGVSLPGVY